MLEQVHRQVATGTIDCSSTIYTEILQKVESQLPFLVGPNMRWSRWRTLAPAYTSVWQDILKRDWEDPKLEDPQTFPYEQAPPPTARDASKMLHAEEEMWSLGLISRVEDPHSFGCILRNFPVAKSPTEHPRIVVDGSQASLNEDVPSYRGTSEEELKSKMQRNSYLLRSDLRKMFWQIRARPSQQNLQRFWSAKFKSVLCRMLCMTMGIKGASGVATRLMRCLEHIMDTHFAVWLHTYVDEQMHQNKSPASTYLDTLLTRTVMVFLGFKLNWKKSMLTPPTQSLPFCGIVLHSRFLTASPIAARLEKIRTLSLLILHMLEQSLPIQAKLLSSILGSIHTMGATHQMTFFCTRKLEIIRTGLLQKHHPVTKSKLRQIILPPHQLQWCQTDLVYWSKQHSQHEWRWQIPDRFHHTLTTDASCYAIGMDHLHGFKSRMFLSAAQRQWSHNAMEGLAGCEGVDTLLVTEPHHQPTYLDPLFILLQLDNNTAKKGFNDLKSRSSQIMEIMQPFQSRMHQRAVCVRAFHINKLVMDTKYQSDRLGRIRSLLWCRRLHNTIFKLVCSRLCIPPETPILDLAASNQSRQGPHYVSLLPDHRARFINMFSELWNHKLSSKINSDETMWVFPPENQIPAVLRHLEMSGETSIIMMVPVWKRPWLSKILHQSSGPLLLLQGGTSLLSAPEGAHCSLPLAPGKWTWLITKVGSTSYNKRHRQPKATQPPKPISFSELTTRIEEVDHSMIPTGEHSSVFSAAVKKLRSAWMSQMLSDTSAKLLPLL